jgi:sodium-dependent dicarboxylate transporter 2/3/5
MARAGFLLNIFSILLISFYTYYLLPLIWDFDLNKFPSEFINLP